jgi:hypothetical protein
LLLVAEAPLVPSNRSSVVRPRFRVFVVNLSSTRYYNQHRQRRGILNRLPEVARCGLRRGLLVVVVAVAAAAEEQHVNREASDVSPRFNAIRSTRSKPFGLWSRPATVPTMDQPTACKFHGVCMAILSAKCCFRSSGNGRLTFSKNNLHFCCVSAPTMIHKSLQQVIDNGLGAFMAAGCNIVISNGQFAIKPSHFGRFIGSQY